MDDEFNSAIPSINFDKLPLSTIVYQEEDSFDEDEEAREQEMEEKLDRQFADLSDLEASDSTENESGESDESESFSGDSQHGSELQKGSQSEQYQAHSMENSTYPLPIDYSASYPCNQDPVLSNCYSDNHQLRDNASTDEGNHPQKEFTGADNSYESNKESAVYDLDYAVASKYQSNSLTGSSDLNHNYNENAGQSSNPVSSVQYNNPVANVQEEYMTLRTLYEALVQDFEHLKQKEMKMKKSYSQEMRDLSTRLSLLEGEKERLSSSLQESQSMISDFRHQNNVLRGEINALEIQLSSEKAAKTNAMSELQSKEVTIQSLERNIKGLAQSENGLRLKQLHESILQDLKLRHEKEVASLRQSIDSLQKNLDTKVAEAESLKDKVLELEQKCKELQEQNEETYNKFTTSRRQYQELFESGTAPEMGILKMKLQHSEDENLLLKNEIDHLKNENKSLEAELHTSKALEKYASNNSVGGKEDCDSGVQLSEKKRHIQEELERALKQLRSQRSLNNKLKKELDEFKRQLPVFEEKAKLFQSLFSEEKKKVNDLEQKLSSLCPKGSITVQEHEKKVRAIENDLTEWQNRLHDATERLKILSANEDKLTENNKHLQTEIVKMKKEHSVEKLKAVERCREKSMHFHEKAINKIKDQHNQDLKATREHYEHKITQLQKEIQALNDGIYEAKAQYLKIADENKDLQSKIENMSKSKEMHDIEAKFAAEYEKKIDQLKEQYQKQYKEDLEQQLRLEIQKIKEDWAKQKMIEVKDYISTTTKQYDEEFQKCVDRERKNFQNELALEIAKCNQECQEQLNSLRKQYDDERKKLISAINESSQSKSKAEVIELQQKYEKERILVKDYKAKIASLQNTLSEEKNKLMEKETTFERVTMQLKNELIAQKEKWDKEKLEQTDVAFCLREKVNAAAEREKKLRENVKKYQRHAAATEKHFKEKLAKLETQLHELEKSKADKQNHIQHLEKQYSQDVLAVSQKFRKPAVSLREAESQTEDQVVLKKTVVYKQELFISSLKAISDAIQEYLENMRKRTAQHLQETLSQYHNHLISEVFQDVSKSTYTFTPSML